MEITTKPTFKFIIRRTPLIKFIIKRTPQRQAKIDLCKLRLLINLIREYEPALVDIIMKFSRRRHPLFGDLTDRFFSNSRGYKLIRNNSPFAPAHHYPRHFSQEFVGHQPPYREPYAPHSIRSEDNSISDEVYTLIYPNPHQKHSKYHKRIEDAKREEWYLEEDSHRECYFSGVKWWKE